MSCTSQSHCSGDLLPPGMVQAMLESDMKLWSSSDRDGKLIIHRKFTTKNFQCALDAINDIGSLAERSGHHPDLHLTSYRDVEIVIYTHTIGGISHNDIDLAKLVDKEVKVCYSPKWLRDHPDAQFTAK